MVRTCHVLDVFIASPGDIIKEREVVELVIKEINSLSRNKIDIMLHLLDLDLSTYSSVGDYTQKNIIDQIGDYDIFIGLLWNRFGTETPGAKSGTEEEFNNAMKKHEEGKNINILLYFSKIPTNPEDIDTKELEKVRKFKKQKLNANSKNFCYEYDDIKNFENKIRMDLNHIIGNYNYQNSNDEIIAQENNNSQKTTKIQIDEDNLGFIENIEESYNNFETANKCIVEVSNDIEKLGNEVSLKSKEMNPDDMTSVKMTVNLISEDMNSFTEKLERKRPKIRDNFSNGLNNILNIASTMKDYNLAENKDLVESANNLINETKKLKKEINPAIDGINKFKKSIESLPPFTNKFIRSKKNIIKSTNDFINDLKNMINMIEEFEKQIEDNAK